MKDLILKGHPLTENESKEVKGGGCPEIKSNVEIFFCPVCGFPLESKKSENGGYTATCMNCIAPLPEMD